MNISARMMATLAGYANVYRALGRGTDVPQGMPRTEAALERRGLVEVYPEPRLGRDDAYRADGSRRFRLAARLTAAGWRVLIEAAHAEANVIDPFTTATDVRHRQAAIRSAMQISPSTVTAAQRAEVERAIGAQVADQAMTIVRPCAYCDEVAVTVTIDPEAMEHGAGLHPTDERKPLPLCKRHAPAPTGLYLNEVMHATRRIDRLCEISIAHRAGMDKAADALDIDMVTREARAWRRSCLAIGRLRAWLYRQPMSLAAAAWLWGTGIDTVAIYCHVDGEEYDRFTIVNPGEPHAAWSRDQFDHAHDC